ncbi:AI-2E family transporter [Microbacterium rhizophilus]|uniref:AI-2E family transporter n=1 Tax=Microbacterium rhizophilus TaxID=3138934 RepID=UPI0031EFCCC7
MSEDDAPATEPTVRVEGDAPVPAESTAGRTSWAVLRQPFRVGFLLTLGGLAAIALGVAVWNLSTVLVYIAFALFIALGLRPLVRRLQDRGVSRTGAIVAVCAGAAIVLAGILLLVIPTVVDQIAQFVRSIPDRIADFQVSDAYAWLEDHFGDQVGTMLRDAQTFLTTPANIAAIGGGVLQLGTTVATGLSGVVIVLVLSLYFLASLPTMKTALVRLAPARNRGSVLEIASRIAASVGSYLGGMVVLALINAVFAFVLHLILRLPFPQLMAVIAFSVTLIPLVGSVLFWAIASALALVTSPLSALIFAVVYLVYMQLEAYLLTPRVMNRAIAVPGSLVVIGALVGGTLLGLLGALVAIPVTASILLIVKQVVIPRQDAKV